MRPGRIALINILGLLIIIIVGAIGFYIWHQGYYYYSTDDATVSAPTANVASLLPGTVASVSAAPNQQVNRGQTIVSLNAATGVGGPTSGSNGASSASGSSSGSGGGSGGSGSSSGSGSSGSSGSASGGTQTTTNATGATGATGGGTTNATSPLSGTLLYVSARPGQFAQPGQSLAQVADLAHAYITAYVDEGHIKDIHLQQGVDVSVDSYPGIQFHGVVKQIVPATASTFSLLPANNYASGNFTKVSQRIPVIVSLDGLQGQTLLPNTSASVTIHIHS